MKHLSESECEKVLLAVIKSHTSYLAMIGRAKRDSTIETKSEAMASWYSFFKNVLALCSAKFLVSNASLWFAIGHNISDLKASAINKSNWLENHVSNWDNFVFNQIIPKFGTQNAFDFGLCLVDYIVFCKTKSKYENFDQRYFHFLKHNVGITWNLA